VLFDNIRHPLESGTLSALLTAPTWSDRLLGKTQTVELPNRTVWLATGNNLQLNNEIARRTAWIRLDAKVDRPWERTNFRHDNLTGWLQRHRHELVWALLVLVQYWMVQGRPPWEGKPLGSYEAWSSVIGGILRAAGIEGFLANRDELYRRTDAETEEWRAFVSAWWDTHGDAPVRTGNLYELTRQWDLLPSIFAAARDDASERALKTRLGKALGQRRDRRYGDFFIRSLGHDTHHKGALYRLESADSVNDSAERSAPNAQPSADVPQHKPSTPDTIAERAEHAERVFNAKTEKRWGEKKEEETPNNVPQLPHLPQTDTDSADLGAEGERKVSPNVPQNVPQQGPPRCRKCGLPMNVARVSDICGRCKRDG